MKLIKGIYNLLVRIDEFGLYLIIGLVFALFAIFNVLLIVFNSL